MMRNREGARGRNAAHCDNGYSYVEVSPGGTRDMALGNPRALPGIPRTLSGRKARRSLAGLCVSVDRLCPAISIPPAAPGFSPHGHGVVCRV